MPRSAIRTNGLLYAKLLSITARKWHCRSPCILLIYPASPLKTDKRRPIPAGAALSQQPTTAGTLTPDPTSGESAGAPSSGRPTTSRTPRPEPTVTKAPQGPELSTGEAGVEPTTVPVTATPEGEPDTTTTTTNTGMGSSRTSSGEGSAEESAPRTTS